MLKVAFGISHKPYFRQLNLFKMVLKGKTKHYCKQRLVYPYLRLNTLWLWEASFVFGSICKTLRHYYFSCLLCPSAQCRAELAHLCLWLQMHLSSVKMPFESVLVLLHLRQWRSLEFRREMRSNLIICVWQIIVFPLFVELNNWCFVQASIPERECSCFV